MFHEAGPQSFAHCYFLTGLSTADRNQFQKKKKELENRAG